LLEGLVNWAVAALVKTGAALATTFTCRVPGSEALPRVSVATAAMVCRPEAGAE